MAGRPRAEVDRNGGLMAAGPRVEVDRDACRGAAMCTNRAPHTFSLDAAHRAVASDPPGDPEEALRLAEQHCPNFAIRVRAAERSEA